MSMYRLKDPRFSINLRKVKTTPGPDGRMRRVLDEKKFFFGDDVELTDGDALEHMHKIEPADDAARALWKAYHDEQEAHRAARVAAAQKSTDISADAIAAAVVKALAEAGMLRTTPAKST